ncbi:CoA transferase [Aquihabitans sp. G128]|uniref:CaiB/BaiF CoA transferase family protein n=1 Tax=Aquihabitans sp. G128 TaxID=2849779 RepID=UPI001C24E967|nr:CaiB/BaiF CoA-transferase family protein [Aquihabitans sp. G128]QXC61053.1 CoA transferase [Aquihabitans sp. G128]
MTAGTGPLAGVRVVELAGLGPGPFAGMLLGDLGADVLVVDRVGAESIVGLGALGRGKRSVGVDLRSPEGVEVLLRLVEGADVLVDVYRPGVAERLGFGPDVCHARNERLVYGRLTGFGQDGPLASRAGHDLGYLASSGALDPLGRAGGPPSAPINVLADFAGGGELLVVGVLAALVERATSGKGQVIDAAMVDGSALLLAPFYAGRHGGGWGPRGTNLLDGAAPFYDVYECADGRWLAVGAIEPQFYAALVAGLGLADELDLAAQYDEATWPATKARIAEVVRTRTRDEWAEVYAGVDACVEAVVETAEAPTHPHHVARDTFVWRDGNPEPGPAPRFDRTPAARESTAPETGVAALASWGFTDAEVAALSEAGTVA